MKKIVLCLITLLLLTSCGKTKQDVKLVYQNDIKVDTEAFDSLNFEEGIESIILLKIDDKDKNRLFGIMGDESKEYVGNLYYDVYKLKDNDGNFYIYYHIITNKDFDINQLEFSMENDDRSLTKYQMPSKVSEYTYNFNAIEHNGNYFIFSTKSEEAIKRKGEKEEENLWFTFIPLNCSSTSLKEFEFTYSEINDAQIQCNGLISQKEIATRNTHKPIVYSPINSVLEYSISYDVQNFQQIENDIKDFAIKYGKIECN